MKRIAILDLGTNTFNLIIAEVTEYTKYNVILSKKTPVKLGEGHIDQSIIIQTAINRAIKAIDSYFIIINNYNVDYIKAYGTSALRSAANKNLFLSIVKDKTGIEVEIITGDREAELIYKGVRQTLLLNNHKFLILDIGGGSNELILADMKRIYWKKSYPLGIARLLEQFSPSDPLTQNEVIEINQYLLQELHDLFELLKVNNINTLVGASGSFETFVHMIKKLDVVETEGETEAVSTEIRLDQFNNLHNKLLFSTLKERKKMKGLEPMRIEMIVLASLFVKLILDNHPFEKLYQSNYALKEGVIFEILNKQ